MKELGKAVTVSTCCIYQHLPAGASAAASACKPYYCSDSWVSSFQIRVYTYHLEREGKCSFLGFAATDTDGGGAGGELVTFIFNVTFKKLLVPVAGRLHFEDNNFIILGNLG